MADLLTVSHDFDSAFSELQRVLVDLDGDGEPDAEIAVPSQQFSETTQPAPYVGRNAMEQTKRDPVMHQARSSGNAMVRARESRIAAEPADLPPDPSEAGDALAAGALGAVDVLGIPSAVAGRVFGPEVRDAMRGPQERNPNAAMAGAVLSPMNAMAAAAAAGLGIARGASLAGRGMRSLEGAHNAMASARRGIAVPYLDEAQRLLVQPGPLVGNTVTNAATGAAAGAGADYLERGELDSGTVLNAMGGGLAGGVGTVGGFVSRRGADRADEISALRSRIPSAAELERSGVPLPYAGGPPVQTPQGVGMAPRSRHGREESSDFYADLYRDEATLSKTTRSGGTDTVLREGRLPEHVKGIRDEPHGYRGPDGRWVTHETGMTAKKLGFPKKR